MRLLASLAIFAALCSAGCYSHYAWIGVAAADRSGAASPSSERSAVFSEAEQRTAVDVAASVATRLGLQPSWMQKLDPRGPAPGDPFRQLALFQGSGANSNLMLTVAVAPDGSQLHFWISDLDHAQETPLVRDLVTGLEEALARAFPGRHISGGEARRLRLFEG